MKRIPNLQRAVHLLILIALASALAPHVALAGHAYGRRFKGGGGPAWCGPVVVHRAYAPSGYYYRRSSDAGPALAGFLGGLVLGAVVTHAADAGPRVHDVYVEHHSYSGGRYLYEDPCNHRRFDSLGDCEDYVARCDHPRVIRVIDRSSGDCVNTYSWSGGRWCSDGDGRRYDDRYDDRDRRDYDDRDDDRYDDRDN